MKLISAFAAALTFCGRHGTLIAAASIFIGLAVPPLAAAFRPHLGEAIVIMLTLAFLRVDPGGIASALDAARPDRRRNGLDNAHLARRAWHAVSGVQTPIKRCPDCISCWCCKCLHRA